MNRTAFFKAIRHRDLPAFTPLSQPQVDGLNAILDACIFYGADLGQTGYALSTGYGETGGKMQPRRENMNYSAKRLMQVWPTRFKTKAQATKYAGRPRELANYVYGDRMGNRPGTDDGWNHRGAGMGQITGAHNFGKWADNLGVTVKELGERLGSDLVFSAHALVRPMLEGWATGIPLSRFVEGDRRDYRGARAVWGGVEASKYATYARAFEAALIAAGYTGQTEPAPIAEPEAPAATPATEIPAQGAWAAFFAALGSLFARTFTKERNDQ